MTFGQLTQTLLTERNNYKLIFDSLHALHEFYSSVTGVSAEQTTDNNIYLPTGKAISPGQAAHCLLDVKRTTTFLRGVTKAVQQLQRSFPNEPIHILYAGCGPYATLLTPLTTLFSPQEVRFHLVDVHKESLAAVRALYEKLDATAYLEEMICADASEYKMSGKMHLVITEALQKALQREPQVSMVLNLVPQMEEGTVFIPQEIRVSGWLLDREQEMLGYMPDAPIPERVPLGEVCTIGQDRAVPPQPVSLPIPKEVGSHNEFYLLTDIKVFEDEVLGINDCGLTLPHKVADVGPYRGKTAKLEYIIGADPGFKISFE